MIRAVNRSGGVTTDEMSGGTENAFLSAIKLHVTGNLALIRAAEEELIKNKVSTAALKVLTAYCC